MANKPIGKPAPKPLQGRVGPNEDEQEQQQAPQRQARSKADLFNNAEPESGFSVPVGSYVAHLVAASHEKDDTTEKESVKFSYEVSEGEFESKTITAWYNLFDKDGNPQRGSGFLKRDMALLQGPDLDYEQLQEQLDELVAERPLCNLTVKQNGQWTNVFLQGLAEG